MTETPIPKIRWKAQLKLYDQLFAYLRSYVPTVLGDQFLRQCAKTCARILRLHDHEPSVVDTLVQYAGTRLTLSLCDQLARQLVSRKDELVAGPLLRTSRIAGEGWHMGEFMSLREETQFGKLGQVARVYLYTGQLAGHFLSPWLPNNLFSYVAYQALGFSRRTTYEHEPHTLVGLRFWALLREDKETTSIVEWGKDALTAKHNRPIICLRTRLDQDVDQMSEKRAAQYSCPKGFDHYCSACDEPVSECPASMHRDFLVQADDHQSGGSRSGGGHTG